MGLGDILLDRGQRSVRFYVVEKNGEGDVFTGENGDLLLISQETDGSDFYAEKVGFVTSRMRERGSHIDPLNTECNLPYFSLLGTKEVHLSPEFSLRYMERILGKIAEVEEKEGIKILFVGKHEYDPAKLQHFRDVCARASPERPSERVSGAYSRADIAKLLGI